MFSLAPSSSHLVREVPVVLVVGGPGRDGEQRAVGLAGAGVPLVVVLVRVPRLEAVPIHTAHRTHCQRDLQCQPYGARWSLMIHWYK